MIAGHTPRVSDWDREPVDQPPHASRAQAAAVARVLIGAERILVQGHNDPDGDACGTCLAFYSALTEMGKQVVVYAEKPYPHNYAWLPFADRVVQHIGEQERFDATLVCDAGSMHRIGPESPPAPRRGTLCWIDHHPNESPPGDVNYVDTAAPAVSEQVREILRVLDHRISTATAKCIYAALVSDTGSFRYSNTTPRALTLASEMVASGVDVWEMTEQIYESQPKERLLLLGQVLPTLEVSACGGYASITITESAMAKAGANSELTDGFVNFPRSIAGVEVALQFREQDDTVKVGFRSRGNVDVSQMARSLGGGGHHNAAGCVIQGTLSEVRTSVYQQVGAELDKFRKNV